MNINDILAENDERNNRLKSDYDPLLGIGCHGERVKLNIAGSTVFIPIPMIEDPDYRASMSPHERDMLRFKHDFEYWAAKCAHIKDKTSGKDIPFILNTPQRRLLAMLEEDRLADRPCRLIMLKARQWGGSTLVQIYMAWRQIIHAEGCHSLICAHVKDTAATIRGMYSKLLDLYPEVYQPAEKPMTFAPFEGSRNTRQITGRNCRVTIGSSERQDSIRGADYAMAHLSEVAFWKNSPGSTPENFIRSINGAINYSPGTLVVLESTANGTGTFFHREWLRARNGTSDKKPLFVPWYEIEIYRSHVADPQQLWDSMDTYERWLWNKLGLTLEMIQWYHDKRREYPSHDLMQAEYPTNDVEAFSKTGSNIFALEKIEALRRSCTSPAAIGEISGMSHIGPDALRNVRFIDDQKGKLKIWKFPDSDRHTFSNRYVVAVDIGGRSPTSDYSVIAVFDRGGLLHGGKIEVAAQWRGHDDHDIIAWKSASIARFYGNALLIIESNSIETDNIGGDPSLSVLSEIYYHYPDLYVRHGLEGGGVMPGFHTNRATKSLVINRLLALVREQAYIERDDDACDELAVYEQRGSSFAAIEGCHDDILMTRAIGLYVASELPVDDIRAFSGFTIRHDDSSEYSIFTRSEVR